MEAFHHFCWDPTFHQAPSVGDGAAAVVVSAVAAAAAVVVVHKDWPAVSSNFGALLRYRCRPVVPI